MTDTLTDRYVDATARRLEESQRPEVERELREMIEDLVEGRLSTGEVDRAAAERAVLTELGDPVRLAAEYSGRPLHLIGPAVYPDWLRLVRLLLAIVPPLAATANFVVRLVVSDPLDVGDVLAGAVVTGLTAALHVVFWTTLAFAVVERTSASGGRPVVTWTPDHLPESMSRRRVTRADTVGSLAALGVTAGALVWQQLDPPARRDGEPVPLLDPALWGGWMWWLLGVLVAGGVLTVVVHRAGAWRPVHAVVNVALELAFAVPVVGLALSDRLVNPDVVELLVEGGWAGAADHLDATIVAGTVLVTVWGAADGVLKARRHASEG
jgi:hypothetical protein